MKHLLKLILSILLLCLALAPNTYAETKNPVSISVQATSPSAIISPSAITLIKFDETERVYGAAFAIGTAKNEIVDYIASFVDDFVGYDMDGMDYWLPADNWSFTNMDTNTPGLYYALSVPELGDDYLLMDGVSLPEMRFAVSIQTPGKPSLNNCFTMSYSLWFPWVLSQEQATQPDAFTVYLQQDDGDSTLITLDKDYWIQQYCLMIDQYLFEDGKNYVLKVICPNGETSLATFLYKGDLTILDDYSGDRDGGDVIGGGIGVGTQPAPILSQKHDNSKEDNNHRDDENAPVLDDLLFIFYDTAQDLYSAQQKELGQPFIKSELHEELYSLPIETKPETATLVSVLNPIPDYNDTPLKVISEPQQPTIITESYSPTQTVISGLRLKDLCKENENIVFGSGNLTVSIPHSLLLALNLSDSDTLTVQLTQPQNNQILLTVDISGKLILELPGTVIRYRYVMKSENEKISVQNEAGQNIADTNFDGELLRFSADTAGTYTVLAISDTQKTRKSKSLLIFLTVGTILTVGGITCFWRRYHG
ncbi:MAG: hypothetical protein ACERKZ_16200 [Lachnotalea sp.]